MAAHIVVFATFVTLACASHPLGNVFKKHSMVHPKDSKQLLSCMAQCIDHRLSQELENCKYEYPIGFHTGVHGHNRRRIGDHMVAMTREELLTIVNCVSRSGDRIVQSKFDVCNQKQPAQNIAAFRMCSGKIVGASGGPAFYDAMAEQPILPAQIFECIRENTVEYTPKEASQQIAFENCARAVDPGCHGHKSHF